MTKWRIAGRRKTARYPKHARLDAVAVARALDGSVSLSSVATFVTNG
jgi:hypothetical protein